jgi:hypothetical protein
MRQSPSANTSKGFFSFRANALRRVCSSADPVQKAHQVGGGGRSRAQSRPWIRQTAADEWGPTISMSTCRYVAELTECGLRDALQLFLRDGRIPIDNNDVEQLMKQVALGRKNWLFLGSVE